MSEFIIILGKVIAIVILLVTPIKPTYHLPVYPMYWGSYPCTHWGGSNAVDIFAPIGTEVIAVTSGWSSPGDYSVGGKAIMLDGDDGYTYYYAHLRSTGRAGYVNAGDVIGYVGLSGSACKPIRGVCTGEAHLHFSISVGPTHHAPLIWAQGAFEEWGYFVGKCEA